MTYEVSLGVGDGSGKLFVHGDYESIKAAQKLILERNNYKAALQRIVEVMNDPRLGDADMPSVITGIAHAALT